MNTETRIEAPRPDTARCVGCGARVLKHEALRVTIERRAPYVPGTSSAWTAGGVWARSRHLWSAAGQAMLNAAYAWGPAAQTEMPPPTHVIDTYSGFACSQACAERAVTLELAQARDQ